MDFAMKNLTAGQLNAIVKKLGGEKGALSFLRNELKVINLDADPFVPQGWMLGCHNGGQVVVGEHQKGGQMIWDEDAVALHIVEEQNSDGIESLMLHKKLKGLPVMNANVLDFLLANPYLIPEEWKSKAVYFWGTVYRAPDYNCFVRCLSWSSGGHGWVWEYDWVGGGNSRFYHERPALIRVPQG